MPRRATLGMLLLLNLALMATSQARWRYDALLYDLPEGWAREFRGHELVLTSTDKTVTVAIARSRPVDKDLDAIAAGIQAEAASGPGYHADGSPFRNPHVQSGGEILSFSHSYSNPAHPEQQRIEAVTLFAAGGRCAAITVRAATRNDIERN